MAATSEAVNHSTPDFALTRRKALTCDQLSTNPPYESRASMTFLSPVDNTCVGTGLPVAGSPPTASRSNLAADDVGASHQPDDSPTTVAAILASDRQCTVQRMKAHATALVIQDGRG